MATIKIHNAETGEVIEREMTAPELAQWEADKTESEARVEAAAEAAAKRQALFDILRIIEEESKLLFI